MELAKQAVSTNLPSAVEGEYLVVTDLKEFAQARKVGEQVVWVSLKTGKPVGAAS